MKTKIKNFIFNIPEIFSGKKHYIELMNEFVEEEVEKALKEEKEIFEKYPALKEAWENYVEIRKLTLGR